MKKLFHTVLTSARHREHGYCDESDFAKIELIELYPHEKELIVSFNKYGKEKNEYIEYDGFAYNRLERGHLPFSRDEDKTWFEKQGKFSPNTAIELMLKLRESARTAFYGVYDKHFILIGRTLYQRGCEVKNLGVTAHGNLIFSHWWSIDIQSHINLDNRGLSKSVLQKVIKDGKKRFEETKGGAKVDNHSGISYPTQVKWGEKYNH